MKKYFVIGNPIQHSLSPQLHNYWLKENNINGNYDKKKLDHNEIEEFILSIKKNEINGINITIPFKKKVIPFLDDLSNEAKTTQSVNTILIKNGKIIGHNTDIGGFELAIKSTKFNPKNKKILILGAGGVVSSIVFALRNMGTENISVSNRTKSKAEDLQRLFKNLSIVEWGDVPNFDMIINATSLGLNKHDEINLDFSKVGKNKFFYDIIYNPKETNFLKIGKKLGNLTENGKMMFIYQAFIAFKMWHGVEPNITSEVIKLLD